MAPIYSRRSWPHSFSIFLLLILQALNVFASSLKASYTLAYAPVDTTATSKPTAFAVLVSHPATPPPPVEQQKQKTARQGKSDSGVGTSKQPLNQIGPIFSYDSYTPASQKDTAQRARIGVLSKSGKEFNGSTTLTTLSALQDPLLATLYVQLDAEEGLQSVSLRESMSVEGAKKEKKSVIGPNIEVLHAAREPRPVLNKPVILNAEGKVNEEPQEKTLLQKYWWVGLIVLALTMMGGDNK